MTATDAYRTLATKHGYENSTRYRSILEYLMTPEEAELVALLPGSYEDLAGKVGIDPEAVRKTLEKLYWTGAIFAMGLDKLEQGSFALGLVQFHDITMCTFEVDIKRDRKLFDLWDDFCVNEWDGDQVAEWDRGERAQGRIVPAYKAIPDGAEALPCEDLREIIKSARSIAVTHCTCRRRKEAVENKCDSSHSMVDIQFNLSAEYLIARNAGKRVSADEAMALFDEFEDLGLLHTCENSDRMRPRWGMCNCCVDCCMIYEPMNRFGVAVTKCVAKSRYEARVEQETCTGCQICLDWCRFGAIEMERAGDSKKFKAVVDPEKCMGCGVCVLKCDDQALKLHLVRPPEHIPQAL